MKVENIIKRLKSLRPTLGNQQIEMIRPLSNTGGLYIEIK